jgi:hypothetical protein
MIWIATGGSCLLSLVVVLAACALAGRADDPGDEHTHTLGIGGESFIHHGGRN